MRTTLIIDDDLLEIAKAAAAKRRFPLHMVIIEALRAGLPTLTSPPTAKPYQTKPHRMGSKVGQNLDNIQELLTRVDGKGER